MLAPGQLDRKMSVPVSAYQPPAGVEPVGMGHMSPQMRFGASGVFLCIAGGKGGCGLLEFHEG